jgi:cell division protein FtsQ
MGDESSQFGGWKNDGSHLRRLRKGTAGIEFSPRSRGRPGRSRRLRFRRLLSLIALLLFVILCAESAVALFTSHRFALREVRVEGASEFTFPVILQHAPSPGPNLFSLPARKALRRIQGLSFVKEAALKRRLPGTLIIRLKEREPIAFARQKQGTVFFDREGIAFLRPGPIPGGIVEMQGLEVSPREMGRRITGTSAEALHKGLSALAQNPQLKAKTLVVNERGWITVHLVSGTELRLGPAEELEEKMRVIEEASASLGPLRSAEYFDVSAPDAAVWKPRQSAQ